jgi:hypothetical protein
MRLKRKILCPYGENRIRIHDCVENMGFRREPLMLLYHFNLGYPLLDADTRLLSTSRTVTPYDSEAAKGLDTWHQMQPPTPAYTEQVFYHDLNADADGNTCVTVMNNRLEMGIAFRFNKRQLFNLTQWKQMGEGEYALGIEPCNCYVGGRFDPLNRDILQYLEPGESRNFDLEIELVTNETK